MRTYLAIQLKPLLERLCVVSFLPAGLRLVTRPFGLLSAIVESFGRPFTSAAIAEYDSCVVATVRPKKEALGRLNGATVRTAPRPIKPLDEVEQLWRQRKSRKE